MLSLSIVQHNTYTFEERHTYENIYLKEKIGNPELFTGRKKEITMYLTWIDRIKREIQITDAIGFVFSRSGFTRDALVYFQEYHIAWSDDERWLRTESELKSVDRKVP